MAKKFTELRTKMSPASQARAAAPAKAMFVDREGCRQDGTRAWNEYQATGLHVTMEGADAWLAKLESGRDVGPPECHAPAIIEGRSDGT